MGRLLLALITLACIGGITYWYLTGAGKPKEVTAPAETMQNLRESAKKIEADGLKRAEDIDKKAAAQ